MRRKLPASILLFSAMIAILAGCLFAATTTRPAIPTSTASPAATAAAASKFPGLSEGKRIVFIIDHSGSLLDVCKSLQKEVMNATDSLSVDQSSNAVMVSEHASVMFPQLQKATPEYKQLFAKKLQGHKFQGMNDDLLEPFQRAFERAFAMRPDTIYFLTDGAFDPRLGQELSKLNAQKKVRIHSLGFGNPAKGYEEQLQELARKHGGQYTFVIKEDPDEVVASSRPATTSAPAPTTAPAAKFYGLEAKGSKIVYILNHTGSMLDEFDFLRQDAIRSVNDLAEGQSFNVVMFSEKATAVFAKLQQATAENKKAFARKLQDYRAQGMNCDLLEPYADAFNKAFAMQPEVIYSLTNGHFDPQLKNVIKRLNAGKKVQIHTLAYVNRDPSYETDLRDLAKEHGGTYKFVSYKDLGK